MNSLGLILEFSGGKLTFFLVTFTIVFLILSVSFEKEKYRHSQKKLYLLYLEFLFPLGLLLIALLSSYSYIFIGLLSYGLIEALLLGIVIIDVLYSVYSTYQLRNIKYLALSISTFQLCVLSVVYTYSHFSILGFGV